VCFKCHCAGHYMRDCGKPDALNYGIRLTPPPSYRCDLCGKSGHWIGYCDLKDSAKMRGFTARKPAR
jgi:hypothetical protein